MFWILDETIIDKNIINLTEKEPFNKTLTKLGIEHIICHHNDIIIPTNKIICYGTLKFLRNFKQKCKQLNIAPIPGYYCSEKNLKLSTYYSHYPIELFWNNGYWLPFSMIKNYIGYFCRPDDGIKTFSGQIIKDYNNYDYIEKHTSVNIDTLCFIAKPNIPEKEYRFFVCCNEIITGSKYMENGEENYDKDEDYNKAKLFAIECIKGRFQPDIAYTVDIGIKGKKIGIMEFNSFSCAGFYDCDYEIIAKEISNIANLEYYGVIGYEQYGDFKI